MTQLTLWPADEPPDPPFRVVLRDSPDWYFDDLVLALAEVCGLPHARGVPVAATALAGRIDADGSAAVFAGTYAECRRVADALAGLRPYADAPPLVAQVVGRLDVPDAPPVVGAEPPPAAGESGDPFARTAYRVAQHWRFRCETPEASDVLVITGVEDHPELGVVCCVSFRYEPMIQSGGTFLTGGAGWFAQGDLDRSVLDLVEERGPLPASTISGGDFLCRDGQMLSATVATGRTVGEWVRESAALYLLGRTDEAAPPYREPADEELGLWSLIAHNKVGRLRELLEQHPSLALDPLARDDTDGYCYDGDEFEGCTPLMLAAYTGSAEVAALLLEFGADARAVTARGETGLHFAARHLGGCYEGKTAVARMLCARGADPEARNADGRTPMTVDYGYVGVAEVLIEFGARPSLNLALRIGMIDWARRELRENPEAVRGCPAPESVIYDIGTCVRDTAQRRHGRALRLAGGETPTPGEDRWLDFRAASTETGYRYDENGTLHVAEMIAARRRHAEYQRTAFEECRDLLELAVARGAILGPDPGLFYAAQMFDTSLAEWLLAHGADPNPHRQPGGGVYTTEQAATRPMLDLLHRYGAVDDPYTREADRWQAEAEAMQARLRDAFT